VNKAQKREITDAIRHALDAVFIAFDDKDADSICTAIEPLIDDILRDEFERGMHAMGEN
jgi:hypothetical protein